MAPKTTKSQQLSHRIGGTAMENFWLKSRTKGRELQEEQRKLLRVLRLIKQNYGRVLRKIEWSRLSMVQSQDETLKKNIVPQTMGPDPKVGCEALSSVSPQFLKNIHFFAICS